MPRDKVTFRSSEGHFLSGTLVSAVGRRRGTALFAHCFTCSAQSRAAFNLSRALAEAGVAVLRFDFSGLGESGGEFGERGIVRDVGDLVAAAEWLAEQGIAPDLLIGHSLGGAAALLAAGRIASLKAVATVAAPADAAHILDTIGAHDAPAGADGRVAAIIAGRRFDLAADFIAEAKDANVLAAVRALRLPLLIAHAPRDEIVGIDNARRLFDAARHPKTFLSLDHADHLLTDEADARWLAATMVAWAERYVPTIEAADVFEALPEGVVEVVATDRPFPVAVRAGTHRLVADEPVAVGGQDTGPTPYDLLLAALGACTAMTLKLIAEREGIPLQAIKVRLVHDRKHADDCGHCTSGNPHIQAIQREITVDGALSTEQRARVLDLAAKCPVHRTLTGELHIHDQLIAEEEEQHGQFAA